MNSIQILSPAIGITLRLILLCNHSLTCFATLITSQYYTLCKFLCKFNLGGIFSQPSVTKWPLFWTLSPMLQFPFRWVENEMGHWVSRASQNGHFSGPSRPCYTANFGGRKRGGTLRLRSMTKLSLFGSSCYCADWTKKRLGHWVS